MIAQFSAWNSAVLCCYRFMTIYFNDRRSSEWLIQFLLYWIKMCVYIAVPSRRYVWFLIVTLYFDSVVLARASCLRKHPLIFTQSVYYSWKSPGIPLVLLDLFSSGTMGNKASSHKVQLLGNWRPLFKLEMTPYHSMVMMIRVPLVLESAWEVLELMTNIYYYYAFYLLDNLWG